MRYAVLNLTGTFSETAPLARTLLNAGRARLFRFDAFLSQIEHILDTKKIDTVLIDHHLDFRFGLPGAVEAVHRQLERLAGAGKRVIYYARSYETVHLYLASACSERLIHPIGTVRHQGMARSFLFFKRLLDRFEQPRKLASLPFCHHLDPPIGQVSDVAAHLEPPRHALRGVSEADSLDRSLEIDGPADWLRIARHGWVSITAVKTQACGTPTKVRSGFCLQ